MVDRLSTYRLVHSASWSDQNPTAASENRQKHRELYLSSAQDVLILVFGAKKEKPQQPTTNTRIGHIAMTVVCNMRPSALGVAAKLGSLLSLAFVLVGRRSWLKMSNSPMIKSVIFRELFDCLSVVVVTCLLRFFTVVRRSTRNT